MSDFFSIAAGGGKTRAGRTFSFQTNFDRMLACCVVGGRQDEMYIRRNPDSTCANSILYLEKVPDTLSGKPQADQALKIKLLNLLTRGSWFAEYCNGSYVDSILRPAVINQDPKKFNNWADLEMWHFTDSISAWKSGSLDESVFDVPGFTDLRYNITGASNNEIGKYDFLVVRYKSKVRTFVTLKRIASMKRYEFDGIPLLSMIEGAVQAPKNVHMPFYNVMNDDASQKMLGLPITAALKALKDVMADPQDWAKVSSGLKNRVPKGGKISSRLTAAISMISNPSHNVQNLLEAMENYNIMATDSDLYTIDPARLNVSEDFVRYTNLWNRIVDEPCLVRTNTFNFSRCFIDSLSNLEIDSAGNTLSSGISGAYVSGMQQTTMSEAIVMRADGGDKETLNKIAWEGKVNGLVLSTNVGKWASLNDYYVTSRDENAVDRNIVYKLVVHENGKTVVFGNHGIITGGANVELYFDAYEGRFSEGVSSVTANMLVLLPGNYSIKATNGKINLQDVEGRAVTSTASRFTNL